MRPIIYYILYNFDIVYLRYNNSIDYDNYEIIESLFHEQHLYKRLYQTFLIGV